jgi:two-component system cell cycle response regulator DivK
MDEAGAFVILLVDDLEDNRTMYAEYLTRSGYRVVQAADGLQALALTRAVMPDIIIMDLSLPVLDGWSAIRQLKADELTRAIPIVALTGHSVLRHVQRAQEAGCNALLIKPCLPSALLAVIRDMLALAPAEHVGTKA